MIDLEQKLNREQLRALTHRGNPLLVLAGAGSGKTRVLTYRAFWLIKEIGIEPKKIVLLTFTNKAAGEMTERVKKLLGQRSTGVSNNLGFGGTFHGFCVRLLRMYGETVGVKRSFVIYDTMDQKQVMKRALTNLNLENTPQKIRMYLAIISKYKNNLISIKDAEILAREGYQKTTVSVWREYQRLLNKFEALDFDDLLTRCVKLLKVARVKAKVNKRYEWILVDEYQDTNRAQFELTRLLASDPNKLTVVGDASQAIYSFRGADFRNLILLKKVYKTLKIIELVENYRSTQNILDAAHGVIGNNTSHPILKLVTQESGGEKILMYEGEDGKAEAKFVVSNCMEMAKQTKSTAILYRTNAQSRVLEEELIRAGVSYRLIGGVRFYERAEIKDLLAYLKVIVNKEDAVAWDRIEKLGKRKKAEYQTWLSGLTENLSTEKLIKKILETTRYLERFDKKSEEDLSRLENINELMAVASEFPKTEAFLESVALIQAEDLADRLQPKEARVNLMTIHSAKGLEFDYVFVVGLEEGLLPHSRSLLEKDDLEEERRLLYVAITRARQRLFLSFAEKRFLYGGRSNQTPSRFLNEIPQRLIMRERRIVQDWRVERESWDDFEEIDSW